MNSIARIISIIFVPPSFTLVVFSVLAFTLETNTQNRIAIILVAVIFGFIAPIILFTLLRRKNKLVDLDASNKDERTLPYMISILFYVAGLLILISFKVNIILIAFWFCYISNTIFTILINKHWKISAHAMGAAGPLALIVFIYGPSALFFSALVLLVGWSRIQLKVHTVIQVVAGILLAFFSTYIQIYLITKYLA
jgi:membrane-associated phospholipid phosphatase